jgi:predicted metal-dependent peptidase
MRSHVPSLVRIQKARTTLLLDHPFFGTLLFRLGARPCRSIATMATDGVSLFFNPDFVDTLSMAELAATLAHEVLHPGLQHHTRRNGRAPRRWNMACDYAINPILVEAGLTLPKGVLLDRRFHGMSAERIYNLLEDEEDENNLNNSRDDQKNTPQIPDDSGAPCSNREDDGEPEAPETPGGFGQVLDAPQSDGDGAPSFEAQAREWPIAVEQAENLARLAGKMPAGATRSLEAAQAASVDWRELLRRAWSETVPADYSWMPPNRRHVWSGLYLPGIRAEGAGEVAIAVDCSGSVNGRQLGLFEAEIRSILSGQRPREVHVIYFDAEVHKVESYRAGQPISLAPVG